jgi:hypothetical protein
MYWIVEVKQNTILYAVPVIVDSPYALGFIRLQQQKIGNTFIYYFLTATRSSGDDTDPTTPTL